MSLEPRKIGRRIDIGENAVRRDRHFDHVLRVPRQQRLGADIAGELHHLGEIGGAPQDGIAALCRGAPERRSRRGRCRKGRDQRLEVAALDLPACRRAGSARRRNPTASASRPALSEVLKPSAKAGLCTMVTFRSCKRLGDARGFEARDHDDRVGAALKRGAGDARDDRLAVDGSSSLLRGAMREERPAASTMAAIFALISALRPCRVARR